jgi:YNFM family putative membrane transporter
MPGTAVFRRVSGALFLAGFASFSLLYCVQPILPLLARDFAVGAAESSLALSLSTGFLGLAILCAAALSEGVGRRGLMLVSLLAAASLNLLAALATSWPALLLIRAAEGFMLGGVPAVAMAYLAEEIAPAGLGLAMGLLVGGNAFGGMVGRVLTGMLAQSLSWRAALAILGGCGLAAAAGFILLLPPSRRFRRRPGFDPAFHLAAWRGHVLDAALWPLFAIAFLAMGSFVAIYNYAGFRLMAPPYGLDQGQLGEIFSVYIFGIMASAAAGALVDKLGRGRVLATGILLMGLGVVLTLWSGLTAIIAGIVVVTAGFFIISAVASGWVGRLAGSAKGHATSLYMLAFYMGSSVIGSVAGWFWSAGGWLAVVLFTLTLLALALAAAIRVDRRTSQRA